MITDGDAVWTMVQEDRGTVVVQGPLAALRAAGDAGGSRRADPMLKLDGR
jgi:hypothetical protein